MKVNRLGVLFCLWVYDSLQLQAHLQKSLPEGWKKRQHMRYKKQPFHAIRTCCLAHAMALNLKGNKIVAYLCSWKFSRLMNVQSVKYENWWWRYQRKLMYNVGAWLLESVNEPELFFLLVVQLPKSITVYFL